MIAIGRWAVIAPYYNPWWVMGSLHEGRRRRSVDVDDDGRERMEMKKETGI